jgi:hypothetical protein
MGATTFSGVLLERGGSVYLQNVSARIPGYVVSQTTEPHMKARHYEKHELQISTWRLKILSLAILIATSEF